VAQMADLVNNALLFDVGDQPAVNGLVSIRALASAEFPALPLPVQSELRSFADKFSFALGQAALEGQQESSSALSLFTSPCSDTTWRSQFFFAREQPFGELPRCFLRGVKF